MLARILHCLGKCIEIGWLAIWGLAGRYARQESHIANGERRLIFDMVAADRGLACMRKRGSCVWGGGGELWSKMGGDCRCRDGVWCLCLCLGLCLSTVVGKAVMRLSETLPDG